MHSRIDDYLQANIHLFTYPENFCFGLVSPDKCVVLNTYKVLDKLIIIVCAFCDSESNVFVPN